MEDIKITLPIYWNQSKKSTVLVGMNWFRNAHYGSQAKWKKEFHALVFSQILELPPIEKPLELYRTHISLWYKNPICDAGNIASLIEKATLDALQCAGVTSSDSVKFHLHGSWSVAGQDKENPRCEIIISSI